MSKIKQHDAFVRWLKTVRDQKVKVAILSRLRRFEFGLFGSDVKPVGEGLSELRVDVGKGYRVYFKRRGEELIIVFCGSQKKDQQKQIELARALYTAVELSVANAAIPNPAEIAIPVAATANITGADAVATAPTAITPKIPAISDAIARYKVELPLRLIVFRDTQPTTSFLYLEEKMNAYKS